MNNECSVQFDTRLNVDPVLIGQISKVKFQAFIERALSGHQQIVLETLQRTTDYLAMDPNDGYRPYIASHHVLNTTRGDVAVGIMSEMTRREGKETIWQTTITTVEKLRQEIAAKQDVAH